MDIRVLGAVTVRAPDGVEIGLGGAKQRLVLAMLATHANAVLTVDQLAEGVWGHEIPPRYVQNVQVYISTLRRLLEPDRPPRMPSRIRSNGVGYELVLGPDELDLARFRALSEEGTQLLQTGQAAMASVNLRRALAEWRGEVCADLSYTEFVERLRRQLAEERKWTFEACIDAELANGRARELIAELETELEQQPERERLWSQLITALYRSGRQAEALACCQRARQHLADGFGIDPGPWLGVLERQVLEQSTALDPPRRASVRAARVPVPLTSLVGRGTDVAYVARRLVDARLVALTGPGGVGKTRVALAVAAQHVEQGRTVYFADLSRERDATSVLPVLAAAIGLGDAASVLDVAAAAEEAAALIVIDNFEHVLDAAPVIADLAQRAPAARLLVTSRVRLGVPGETVLPVEPLRIDDGSGPAAQLFRDRAKDIAPFLDLTHHTAAVASICTVLEGVPLAIELAASRVSVLEPEELASHLASAIDSILDVGTAAHRQGSLRAAIRWSTELLAPDERRLLAALSVCEGEVDLLAIRRLGLAIGLSERSTERCLDAIVRASLVRCVESAGTRRYAFLVTTKAAARELLDTETEVRTRDAHARWFTERAVERFLDDEDVGPVSMAGAAAELADCVAAIRRSAALEPDLATSALGALGVFVMHQGVRRDSVRAVAAELTMITDLPVPVRARARVVAGSIAYRDGEPDEAEVLLRAADDLAVDDHYFRGWGLAWRAVVDADCERHAAAAEAAAASLRHARASGKRRLVSTAWAVSSYIALQAGDIERALECAQQEVAHANNTSIGAEAALTTLSNALLAAGRVTDAMENATTALFACVQSGAVMHEAEAYRCLAWGHILAEDTQTAAACLIEQLRIIGGPAGDIDVPRLGEAATSTALVAALAGDSSDGVRLWSIGHAVLHAHGAKPDFPAAMHALAARLGLLADTIDPSPPTDLIPELITMLERVRAQPPMGNHLATIET